MNVNRWFPPWFKKAMVPLFAAFMFQAAIEGRLWLAVLDAIIASAAAEELGWIRTKP